MADADNKCDADRWYACPVCGRLLPVVGGVVIHDDVEPELHQALIAGEPQVEVQH